MPPPATPIATTPAQEPAFSPGRAAAVFTLLSAMLLALIGRVAYLQTIGRQSTIRRADRQQHQTQILPARRGSIFDANGILMAGTIQTETLYVDPKFMLDAYQSDGHSLAEMDDAIEKLAGLIDRDPFELSQQLSEHSVEPHNRYLRIAENLETATVDAIEKLNLPGVGATPASARTYPMGSLAAHVLGGMRSDGVGVEGLEKRFESELAGRDGSERVLKDARRRPLAVAADDYVPPQHGQHLVLTLDSNIQMILEEELEKSCLHVEGKRGEAIVMDPNTGDVLALANWPTFNPQNLDDSTRDTRRNRAITDPYEPGSTIKPFIVGPALSWGLAHTTDVFHLGGAHYTTPYGRHISDVHAYDQLCLWDVLVESSNIGMSMLGERLGNPILYRALHSWDFGQPTGIELLGENKGRLRDLNRWGEFTTESVSQGYEVMVTPLQLCRAFCAYANGGHLVTPHLIKGVLDVDGNVITRSHPIPVEDCPQVVSPAAAATMRRILCDVPIRGTAKGTGTASDIWNIFGKTGTAHISEGKAGYSPTRFNSSFIAGAPYEHPRLVIAFIIHDPNKAKAHYGGWVAAPGASRTLQRALAYLNEPPSPDLPLPPANVASLLVDYKPSLYDRKPKEVADAYEN
jgi:cell division protein FtsI/penicillin-binding protein 2